MESSLLSDFDSQLTYLQQLTRITETLKEKCVILEKDKNEALKMYESVKIKLERLNNRKCTNCTFLEKELKKEREEKAKLKKAEKAKLLKTIAKTLENLEDGNTNVNQLLTELNCEKLSQSPEQKTDRGISLLEDYDSSEGEEESTILVNETIMVDENKGTASSVKGHPIVIPETEALEYSPKKTSLKNGLKDKPLSKLKNKYFTNSKENVDHENEDIIEQANKKLRLSPILSSQNVSPPRDKMQVNQSLHSPSVLSEIIEAAGGSTLSNQDEKGVAWKMKPAVVLDAASTSTAGGKKLKQMTLSLTRTEKKHDISLSDNFRGGVAKHSDEDDIIQPSPEQHAKKAFMNSKKTSGRETLEDPDMTVFNPVITSTCLPAPGETSFDRLPDVEKSPKYKYRRETVRKRVERLKLPGQDCDQCAKYYEAAGLDQTQDVRTRLNQCSRHRDKYQLRANTPPGFWDPVLPTTPEDSQVDHF